MEESLDFAEKELRRSDHLLYVSLKYTRTVDVLKSIIERLINAIAFCNTALLKKAKSEGVIKEVPELSRTVVDTLRNIYADDTVIQNYMDFYNLLRKLDKAEFDRALEYRRHVTMTAHLDDKKVEITIDIITDYFNRTKEYLIYVKKLIHGEQENE